MKLISLAQRPSFFQVDNKRYIHRIRMHTLEGGGVKVVKDNLLHLLVNLLLLAEDDITLALNGSVIQGGVLENVREDLNGLGDIGLEGLGVVDGLLAGSVGVQVSTHVLNLDLKVVLAAGVGALLTDETSLFAIAKRRR